MPTALLVLAVNALLVAGVWLWERRHRPDRPLSDNTMRGLRWWE